MYHYNRQSRSGGDGDSRHHRDRGGEGRQRHISNQRGRSRSRSRSSRRDYDRNRSYRRGYSENNDSYFYNNNSSVSRNNSIRNRDRGRSRRQSTRSPSSSGQRRRDQPADNSYYRRGGTSNRSNRSSRRGSRSYSFSSDDSYYRRGGTSNRSYRSPRRGSRPIQRSSGSSPARGRENAAREVMAQSTLYLRGGLNPALGLGLPGLTDAQGFGTESQQLIRNQQPSALNQLLGQHKSLDGLKSTVPSIEQLLPQNKYPDDLKHTVPSTEQLPAQVNPTYAMNRSASAGQTSNLFESATNLKALVGNDLVGTNESYKPLGTASALTNFFQGSVQCVRPNGYGFISPADGSKDIFFHWSQINKDGIKSNLNGGETVTFNKKLFDNRRKKWYATNVTVIGDDTSVPIQEYHDDGALPPKPPEIGTNIPSTPHTSSNTGDSKKPKKQNYDGGDDDDGYSGDDENEIPSIESLKGNRDKWGFLTSAKRKSTNKDNENVKKMKNTMVTRKQRLPKIPDDALSTIAKLTGDFQSILNLSIADPTLAVTISQWKCCDCDCDGPIFGSDRAYFRSLQEELGILSIPGTAKPFICKHGTFCGRNDCSGSNARQCSQCCDIMECGLCQKSRIADCKICTDVQEDIFYCRNC